MATEYNAYIELADIDMCRNLDALEVEVLVRFFGTQGFSARGDGRYLYIVYKRLTNLSLG